jgi:hypothetical protein
VRALVEERWASLQDLEALETEVLAQELERTVIGGEQALQYHGPLMAALGRTPGERTGAALWSELVDELQPEMDRTCGETLEVILSEGTLATRLLQTAGSMPQPDRLRSLVLELADCLAAGRSFDGR